MECTAEDCGNPCSAYICGVCVRDLQAWIDQIPAMRRMLFTTMAKLDCTRPTNSEGGSGGAVTAPLPLEDRAMDMRYALKVWQGQDASQLAKDKDAGGFLYMLNAMFKEAEKIVDLPTQRITYGPCHAPTPTGPCSEELRSKPEADAIYCRGCGATHQVTEVIAARTKRSRGEPMPSKELREFLHKKTKAFVTKKDIENWVQHGHIKHVLMRVTTTLRPPKGYFPGDVMETHHRMKDRKRV